MVVGVGAYSLLSKKENAHDNAIYCCVWTKITETGDSRNPGKGYIVTGGVDNFIKVWTVDNNKLQLLHTLKGHCMAVVHVAVSPDGHTIASASMDSTLIIWELTTGHKVHEILADQVWKLAFSPDGMQVAAGAFNGRVNIYSVEKALVVRTLDIRSQFGVSLAWSRNGLIFAVGSVDGSVYIFEMSQGKLINTIKAHTETVRDLAFSPNSKLLATASNDGKVKIFDAASATLLNTLDHKSWVLCVRFSPDSLRVCSGAADGCVRVAGAAQLDVLHAFHEHTDAVCGVQFNSNSNKVISVSKDKSINIYECPIPPKS